MVRRCCWTTSGLAFRDGSGRLARAPQTVVLARRGRADPTFSSIEEWLGTSVGVGSIGPVGVKGNRDDGSDDGRDQQQADRQYAQQRRHG